MHYIIEAAQRSWPQPAYLFRATRDANLDVTVAPTRLRSSFIYLANAVNDLSGDWTVLAIVLAPLILAASLCLLPDALNIQHRVAHTFESGHPKYQLHAAQTSTLPGSDTATAAARAAAVSAVDDYRPSSVFCCLR